jgi:hypothetical protein
VAHFYRQTKPDDFVKNPNKEAGGIYVRRLFCITSAWACPLKSNSDGFVKNPSASLRGVLRYCGVPKSTPHSSGFARLASGAFYFAIPILTFYEFINS